jgi:protein O-mannosyl-transferase
MSARVLTSAAKAVSEEGAPIAALKALHPSTPNAGVPGPQALRHPKAEFPISLSDGRVRRAIAVAAILAITFLVFLPTIRYGLVYDDFEQIVTNPRLTAWSYVPGYFTTHLWAHSPLQAPNYYRPIFLLWLRIVDQIFGPPGAMWHLASILAHCGAVVCVLLLLNRLTGNFGAAAMAAALFAIHPIQTEAVAWVSSVSEPLLTIFVVLSVYFHVTRKGPISYASILLAALAMFTKELGIVVPALIFAYECTACEWTRSNFKEAVANAAPSALAAVLYVACRMNALGHLATGVPPNMSVGEMMLTWPSVVAMYGWHLIWPVHLSVCYDVAIGAAVWPTMLLGVVVAGFIWATLHCSANIRFGVAWFVITVAPGLSLRYLLRGDYVHDRYLYLPLVGVALVAAEWISKIELTPARVVTGLVLLALCCWGVRANLPIWHDDIALFRRAVETAPRNPYAKNNLADAYLKAHREAEAYPLLEEVIALDPDYRLGYYNMGRYYQQVGNASEADEYFTISDQMYYSARGQR